MTASIATVLCFRGMALGSVISDLELGFLGNIIILYIPSSRAGDAYIDALDATWTRDTKLLPVDLNKLRSRTFVVYKFGTFVVDMLVSHCQHRPITLLLADAIPPNADLSQNAYRNSFHYDANNRILYVRTARLESVGQFVLVLVHTLVHIHAGKFDARENSIFC